MALDEDSRLHKRGVEADAERFDDLRGFRKMLDVQVERWTEQWKKQGFDQGYDQSQDETMSLFLAQRLQRALTDLDRQALHARLEAEGPERVTRAILAFEGEALEQWLHAPLQHEDDTDRQSVELFGEVVLMGVRGGTERPPPPWL